MTPKRHEMKKYISEQNKILFANFYQNIVWQQLT